MTLIEALNKWENKEKLYQKNFEIWCDTKENIKKEKEKYSKEEYERSIKEADGMMDFWFTQIHVIKQMLKDIKESIGLK